MAQHRSLDCLTDLSIPEDIHLKKDCIVVGEGVKEVENTRLFYREALPASDSAPSSITVLLLHGMMFSSKTWLDLGTIHLLAAMGYRTVAVDLPGYANTPAASVANKSNFLHSIIKNFNLTHPVIVSPSMSGTYSLPYLLEHWKTIAGFIPVAPVGIEVLEQLPPATELDLVHKDKVYKPLREFLHDPIPSLGHIQTPTMVVFGEKDRSRSSALLSMLPMSQCQEIPNGRHPAYLDNPSLWHQLLYNFLRHLSINVYS